MCALLILSKYYKLKLRHFGYNIFTKYIYWEFQCQISILHQTIVDLYLFLLWRLDFLWKWNDDVFAQHLLATSCRVPGYLSRGFPIVILELWVTISPGIPVTSCRPSRSHSLRDSYHLTNPNFCAIWHEMIFQLKNHNGLSQLK